MSKYKNIFAAIDLNAHASDVIQSALSLATEEETRVTALTVVDYAWPRDTDSVLATANDSEEKLVNSAYERLDALLKSIPGAEIERMVVVGRPKQEISRIAEQEGADLIVIGAHEVHGLSGLLGSATDQVVQKAPCDVLVIRPRG